MMNDLLNTLINSIQTATKPKTSPYDSTAVVKRIEDGVAWVQIPGGVDETPVKLTVNAEAGDTVQVRVSGGTAFLVGNATAPPTDDKAANAAKQVAVDARKVADNAVDDAKRAKDAADSAERSAASAQVSANNAQTSADEARTSATQANIHANSALTQLSVVEDVVDVLGWISEHATYKSSTDTEVVAGKYYFARSGSGTDADPYVYSVVASPAGSPDAQGYYELDSIDEAVSNYISTHLALDSAGLWVVKDGQGYKILLANDGLKVYDAAGNLVSTFGESINFSSLRSQYIGGEDAYIVFDAQSGTINIGGNKVTIGGAKTLSQVLNIVENTLLYDHSYTVSNGIATFTAYLYQGGTDVKTQYDPEQFTWYYKTEDSTSTYIGSGYTCTINLDVMGYGGHVIGHFTSLEDAELLDDDDNSLTSSDDLPITGRTPSGETIRVSDLTVSTMIYPADRLMVVGAEDEHLVSIQTLQDYLNANLNKQVRFDTTAGWNAQVTLVSDPNTLYVYTDHQTDAHGNSIAGIKAGDGNAYVVDLPFMDAVATEHMDNSTVHITAQERAFWNEKVRCYYAGTEQLVFTTA